MNKEIPMYKIYDDGEGHRHLIPKDEYDSFVCKLNQAEYELDNYLMETHIEYQDEAYVEELLKVVWECFEDYETLEGEEFYVVLASDLEEGI